MYVNIVNGAVSIVSDARLGLISILCSLTCRKSKAQDILYVTMRNEIKGSLLYSKDEIVCFLLVDVIIKIVV